MDVRGRYDNNHDRVASIHKDPRGKSPFWYCAYTLPNGKRAFKSTKEKDRPKAMAFCLALDRASKLGAKGSLTETRARELISEIIEQSPGEPMKFYTVGYWLHDWLEGKEATKSQGTFLFVTSKLPSKITLALPSGH